jgi:hypothetical protein
MEGNTMKYLLMILMVMLLSPCILFGADNPNNSSTIKSFFSRLPNPKNNEPEDSWEWRPVVAIPALKIVESSRSNAVIDAFILASVGGGVSLQHLKFDESGNNGKGEWVCSFSFSPLTVLLTGSYTADTQLDVSPAMTIGLWSNRIMVGAGYDLGEVSGRSRLFGLLSLGINFNN